MLPVSLVQCWPELFFSCLCRSGVGKLSWCLQRLLWFWQWAEGNWGCTALPLPPWEPQECSKNPPGFARLLSSMLQPVHLHVLGSSWRSSQPSLAGRGILHALFCRTLFLGTLTPLQCALLVWLWCSGLNSPLGWDLEQQPALPSPAEPWGCQELLVLRGEALPSRRYRGSHPDESCWLGHLIVPPLRVSQGFSRYGTSWRGEEGGKRRPGGCGIWGCGPRAG